MFAILVLFIVLALISIRHYFIRLRVFEIWQIMLAGAIVVVLGGSISLLDAMRSVNMDVILCLLGMFVIGAALEESGYLAHITYKLFKKSRSPSSLLFTILFVMGMGSAFLMNDTIAIIGTPIVILLSRNHNISPAPLLMALAFGVTIGGVASPLGNPQNLLIATHGKVMSPFVSFAKYLFVPTVLNLWLSFLFLKKIYNEDFHDEESLSHSQYPIKDHGLAFCSKISLGLLVILIFVKIILAVIAPQRVVFFSLTSIALVSALPPLIFSRRRFEVLKKVDYQTLLFFVGMFILMRAVWDTGFFQNVIYKIKSDGVDIFSPQMILVVSILASQLISNVPLVALYLPLLIQNGCGLNEMMMLASGSTIAGNFSVFGAASNIIILHSAEKRLKKIPLSVWEFTRIGLPITVVNAIVYWIYQAIFWK